MKFEAQKIAQMLGGTVEGNAAAEVCKLCKIEEGVEGGLSFLANPKYTHHIYETKATAVIVNKDFVAEHPVHTTLIRVDNAYMAFAQLLSIYNEMQLDKKGVSQLAFIHPSAKIGENCYIGEFAYIGENAVVGDNSKIYPQTYVGDNVQIGNKTTLFAGVKVYMNCMIGNNCILHSGAVVGADGFGFAPKGRGRRGDWRQHLYRPRHPRLHLYPQRRETGQPVPDSPQRGGWRKHRHGFAERRGRLVESGCQLHTRRTGGCGGTHRSGRQRNDSRSVGRY